MKSGATRRGRSTGHGGFGLSGTIILVAGLVVVCGLLAVAVVGGLSAHHRSSSQADGKSGGPGTTAAVTTTTSRQEALAQLLSAVTMTPSSGGTVQPGGTVSVKADGARLTSVALTTSAKTVTGQLAATGQAWHSTGLLLPSTKYMVSYQVTGSDGLTAQGTGTFRTAAPAKALSASIWPVSGLSVGIGQPIDLTFTQPLSAASQKAVLSRVSIEMSKPVPGGWHWFSPTSLHFRPSHYWPTGEQVQASVNLAGWDLGGGEWGVGTDQSQFVIGASHISVANLATHEMTVYDNGQAIYQWPISAGSTVWPTQDGIHIVLDRTSQVQMISSTVGIPVSSPGGYDETVYWATQISYSGEYVHAAPWSVSEQGLENVSHGCINLSPARAEAFFHFSRVGDIVDVVDGSREPLITDGGLMDWSFPPSQVSWTAAKVGQLTSTVTTLPTTTEPPPAGAPTTETPLPTVPPGQTLSSVPPLPVAPIPTTLPPVTTVPVTSPPPAPTTTVPTTTVPTTTVPKPTTTAAPTTTAPPTPTTVPATPTTAAPKPATSTQTVSKPL